MLNTQTQMLATQNQMLGNIRQLRPSQLGLLRIQNQLLAYLKFTFGQQATWHERQDQFNSIRLQELKGDGRETKKQGSGKIELRLIRLADFMNNQLRKAS